MSKTNFRKAQVNDSNSIYSIIESIGDLQRNFQGLSPKEIKQKIKSRIKIGYSSFRPFDKFPYLNLVNRKLDNKFAYGAGIAIHLDYQGRGYGKIIRKLSLKQAEKEGFEGMYVIIEPSNKISLKIHKQQGFKKIVSITKKNGEKRVLIANNFVKRKSKIVTA